MAIKITIHQRQTDFRVATRPLKKVLASFLHHKNVLSSEVILHFVSEKTIQALHKQFFNDPSSTDCISLPIDPPSDASPYAILGEIFVCPKVACKFAALHDKDPYQEILLYTVHGLLHLLGFDDTTPDAKKIMRSEERKALRYINMLGTVKQ